MEKNITQILSECCNSGRPATLILGDRDLNYWPARFLRMEPQQVCLEVIPAQEAAFRRGALVVVVFQFDRRAWSIIGRLERVDQAGSLYRVTLRFPLKAAAEGRRSTRIPVASHSRLESRLQLSPSQTVPVRIRDISLTGCLLEVPSHCPSLELDSSVTLYLKLGDLEVTLQGVICRQDGAHYGVFFPECLRDQRLVAPQELKEIVGHLEGEWLKGLLPPVLSLPDLPLCRSAPEGSGVKND